ncbi:MAG: fructosamine kinase family protein [Bacteroidetes bacterium]|nr:fructosamine kinase family protein [Bacteroidota bacterium]
MNPSRPELMNEILARESAGGGSINQCSVITTGKGKYFLKKNNASFSNSMFQAEAKGLNLLKGKSSFCIPEPMAAWDEDGFSFLLMEFLGRASAHSNGMFDAGRSLAELHKNSSEKFGLDHHNFIGTLHQSNSKHNSWEEFFSRERMLPQVKRARDTGKISPSLVALSEKFCSYIGEIFPEEKPSLLHGDLWSGNYFHSANGPAVFDPAIYYGHREMDLAMTKLFGGFDEDFYSGYENEFPLEKKWKTRIEFCNLYPLLVHLNLFGGGYVNDVKMILGKF